VKNATLALSGGKLTLGDAVVAKRVALDIECVVTHSDTQKLMGLEPLGHVTAGLRGRLEGMDFTFLDAYVGPRLAADVEGQGHLEIDFRVEGGTVKPGSRIDLVVPRVQLTGGGVQGAGGSTFGFSRPAQVPEPGAPSELVLRSERLEFDVGKAPTASVEDVHLRAAFTPDLARPLRMVRASHAPLLVEVPAVGPLQRALPLPRTLPELGGRLVLLASAEKDGDEPLQGGFRLTLSDATVAVGGRRTLPWNAILVSKDVEAQFAETPTTVGGTLALHVDRMSALLPLITSSYLARDLGTRFLDLEALDATAKLKIAEHVRLDLVAARSGVLKARGWVVERQDGAHGRVLLSTPAANVGMTITPAGTETDLLVGDDWLSSEARPRGGLRRPGRGEMPQPVKETRSKAGSGTTARRLH
jgi:hypothetical protein